ncbi:MAG: hypothetical protein QF392_03325 [Candidatus Poseidoniia archaeon]|nr:hypothetical protein [Candidatus Poseidoniia archaeon]MDP6535134.1 hypothetical protein [Gammaproteobacteria bacterium]MDP6835182.1 hypothetical protein [Candidatus Poseidoniia archaeon]HIH79211.1 hypothetical protein [Candidatus Poseidoniia archaeon]
MEDEPELLHARIAVLEAKLKEEREAHRAEIAQLKSENYDALEASQTRYQGELAIQHANFKRQIAELRARLEAFDA